jgi:AmmeMemoRadiSam system protein B
MVGNRFQGLRSNVDNSEPDKEPSPHEDEAPEAPEEADDFAETPTAILPAATSIDEPIPALRDVRAQLVKLTDEKKDPKGADEENGEDSSNAVLLEDPEGLAQKPAALSMWAYSLASLFNGERSAREVVDMFNEKYGQTIEPEQALELQRELDKAMFLYSRKFERALRRHVRGYLEKEIRPPMHAGTAYPEEPGALATTVDGFFTAPDGPGSLANLKPADIARTDTLKGLLLPHIDLRVGGATYAHGYRELLCNSQAELFVIMGVAHQAFGGNLFYVSQKDYSTPVGLAKTNRHIARRLQLAADAEIPVAELAHRTEHSVEFQAVLLMELLARRYKRDVQIVPILCGSVEEFLTEEKNPLDSAEFQKFAERLRDELEASKKKWLIMCSVDLSHVGPEFGHSTMMTSRLLLPVQRGDQRVLRHIEQLDSRGLVTEIERTQNARHIDAVMAVLTMMEACKGDFKRVRTLHYDQMLKEGTHSAVSYASVAFES